VSYRVIHISDSLIPEVTAEGAAGPQWTTPWPQRQRWTSARALLRIRDKVYAPKNGCRMVELLGICLLFIFDSSTFLYWTHVAFFPSVYPPQAKLAPHHLVTGPDKPAWPGPTSPGGKQWRSHEKVDKIDNEPQPSW